MQYVRSISGSVSKTWNSINPATLSGAIDVIVVEQEDGSLACSPFHVRFGKFSLLRPSEKKVEFKVNGVKQDYSMKLGEGGEAFFVFETSESIPESLQTSPIASPAASPQTKPTVPPSSTGMLEPEPLDLANDSRRLTVSSGVIPIPSYERRARSDLGVTSRPSSPDGSRDRPAPGDWATGTNMAQISRSVTDELLPSANGALASSLNGRERSLTLASEEYNGATRSPSVRSASPPPAPISVREAVQRATNLSKKLWASSIPSLVTGQGDLILDIASYKSNEEDALRAEVIARKILAEELEGNYDIGALIGADKKGNIWIYSSEEAKEAAMREATLQSLPPGTVRSDAASDPGYHSDDAQSEAGDEPMSTAHLRRDSDSAVGLPSLAAASPEASAGNPNKNYAKTLRLTSEQLRAMNLHPGENSMSFTVNRATCQAYIYLWAHDIPIVISDIDGTITKSDALGHVLNMIGRDWTHQGVAKLYTDIDSNGYNFIYLTSRSVGQADTTRAYLSGIIQDGYKLPKGPVIMSPDRTMAALRREIYLRKPEVFKMACLRDIMNLFNTKDHTPFYAGFGNRFTDQLSYRSVNIPSTRIFTINSNAEVSLDVLSLNKYKTGYVSMRELVDHYFPPVGLLVKSGGEEFTDFNYWRDKPLELEEFSASESEESDLIEGAEGEDLEASYYSRRSVDTNGEAGESVLESIEGDDMEQSGYLEGRSSDERGDDDDYDEHLAYGDDEDEGDEDEYYEEASTPDGRTPPREHARMSSPESLGSDLNYLAQTFRPGPIPIREQA